MLPGCVLRPILTATFLMASSIALADTPSVERLNSAAEEFDAGRRAYIAKDYEAAAIHFENADRDAPAPEAIRNAIRAHMDAKNLARAATLSTAMLARYPKDKTSVQFAKQTLAKTEKKLHRLVVECKPACTLLVDGKLSPLPEGESFTLYTEPGTHKLSAAWSKNRHVDREIEGDAAKETALQFKAPPLPPPPAPPPPPVVEPPALQSTKPAPSPKPLSRPVFYATAGATVLLSGITIWSALDMRSDPGRAKVRRDCAGKNEKCPTYQNAIQKQTRTNVLIAVTAGAWVATGVVAYFTRWTGESNTTQEARIRPTFTAGDRWMIGAEGAF